VVPRCGRTALAPTNRTTLVGNDKSACIEEGRIKRQAVRFRVFGFDADGVPVQELTVAEADIAWHVSLANKKAAWFEFHGTDQALHVHHGKDEVPRRRPVVTRVAGSSPA
jgi:L-lysine epsilon oxidase-like protein